MAPLEQYRPPQSSDSREPETKTPAHDVASAGDESSQRFVKPTAGAGDGADRGPAERPLDVAAGHDRIAGRVSDVAAGHDPAAAEPARISTEQAQNPGPDGAPGLPIGGSAGNGQIEGNSLTPIDEEATAQSGDMAPADENAGDQDSDAPSPADEKVKTEEKAKAQNKAYLRARRDFFTWGELEQIRRLYGDFTTMPHRDRVEIRSRVKRNGFDLPEALRVHAAIDAYIRREFGQQGYDACLRVYVWGWKWVEATNSYAGAKTGVEILVHTGRWVRHWLSEDEQRRERAKEHRTFRQHKSLANKITNAYAVLLGAGGK